MSTFQLRVFARDRSLLHVCDIAGALSCPVRKLGDTIYAIFPLLLLKFNPMCPRISHTMQSQWKAHASFDRRGFDGISYSDPRQMTFFLSRSRLPNRQSADIAHALIFNP